MDSAKQTQPDDNSQAETPASESGEFRLTAAFRSPLGDASARYSGNLSIEKLRGIWAVPRLGETENGYQRPLVPTKVRGVLKSLIEGKLIDGTITFSIPPECDPQWLRPNRTLTAEIAPDRKLRVVEGQHRLHGIEEYFSYCANEGLKPRDLVVSVAFYTGLTPTQEAELFERINNTQTKISTSHLAEVRHLFGQESDVEAAASQIYDTLSQGAYRDAPIVRSNFLKLAKPLLKPRRGGRVNLNLENRQMLLTQFLEALARCVASDLLKLNCVIRAACSVFEEVLLQAVEQKFVMRGTDGFAEFLTPLAKLTVADLPSKQAGAVADLFREKLFPILDIDSLLLDSSGGAGEDE
jgi:DGQHR domain-containing protein